MGENKCRFGNKLKKPKKLFLWKSCIHEKRIRKSGVFTPENDRGWD